MQFHLISLNEKEKWNLWLTSPPLWCYFRLSGASCLEHCAKLICHHPASGVTRWPFQPSPVSRHGVVVRWEPRSAQRAAEGGGGASQGRLDIPLKLQSSPRFCFLQKKNNSNNAKLTLTWPEAKAEAWFRGVPRCGSAVKFPGWAGEVVAPPPLNTVPNNTCLPLSPVLPAWCPDGMVFRQHSVWLLIKTEVR